MAREDARMEPYAGSSPTPPESWTYPTPTGEPVHHPQAWPPHYAPYSPPPRSSRRVRPLLCVVVAFALLTAVAAGLHFLDGSVLGRSSQPSAGGSPVAAPSVSAAVAAAPVSTVVARHGRFRSKAAHFAIRFPHSTLSERGPIITPSALGNLRLTVVGDPASGIFVDAVDLGRTVSAHARSRFIAGAEHSIAKGDLHEVKSHRFTLRGTSADEIDLVGSHGRQLTAVVLAYHDGWAYTLLGPQGSSFKHVQRSFRHL